MRARAEQGAAARAPDAQDGDWRDTREAEAFLEAMAQAYSPATRTGGDLLALRPVEPERRAVPPRSTTVGLITIDGHGTVRSFGSGAQEIFGYASEEVVGRHLNLILDCPGEPERPLLDVLARPPQPGAAIELIGRRRDRTTFAVGFSEADTQVGEQRAVTLAVWDLSALDAAEEARRQTEARYRSLIEQIPAVTFMGALTGDVIELYVSPQIEALLGFSQTEWLSDPFLWFNQLHPDDRERCNLEFARGCRDGGPFRAEFRAFTRGGAIVWIRGEARMVRDEEGRPIFIQGIAYDITESKRAEEAVRAHAEQIQASLAEKEVLLKEIHHRVKNNLQVISSLLKLQSGHVQDRAALDMFNESRSRIHTMALVHEKLYQSGNLSRIDFGEYVASLIGLLCRSYGARASRIAVQADIGDVSLGIDVAVPLGMIINELVSNSLKYAFPADRDGNIWLRLYRAANGASVLSVADDGIGFPPALDFHETETLGMQLVRTLTQQIGGSIELRVQGGTEFLIAFGD